MNDYLKALGGLTTLITGANGFLGRRLVDTLSTIGDIRIYAVSRNTPNNRSDQKASNIRWLQADLSILEPVQQLIADIKPDIIYHLASDSRGGREASLVLPSFKNDVQTTVNVLLAAQETGCRRLILTASLEDQNPIPVSPYAAAKMTCKLYGQLFHSLYGLPVTFLRPFMTYGPGQKPYKIIPFAIESFLKGQSPVISSGTRLVDWIYVDDVIEAFIRAATAADAPGHVIDFGSGVLVSVREVMDLLNSIIPGAPPAQYTTPGARGSEIVRCADNQPAAQLLGWQPNTSLMDGLARTVEWHRGSQ